MKDLVVLPFLPFDLLNAYLECKLVNYQFAMHLVAGWLINGLKANVVMI